MCCDSKKMYFHFFFFFILLLTRQRGWFHIIQYRAFAQCWKNKPYNNMSTCGIAWQNRVDLTSPIYLASFGSLVSRWSEHVSFARFTVCLENKRIAENTRKAGKTGKSPGTTAESSVSLQCSSYTFETTRRTRTSVVRPPRTDKLFVFFCIATTTKVYSTESASKKQFSQ